MNVLFHKGILLGEMPQTFFHYLSFATKIKNHSVILCLWELLKVFCTLYYQAWMAESPLGSACNTLLTAMFIEAYRISRVGQM